MLEAANNYRGKSHHFYDTYGYNHAVSPYYEITSNDLMQGYDINNIWYVVVGDALDVIRKHNSVMVNSPMFNHSKNLVIINVASDSTDDLLAVLNDLSEKGWATGVNK